MKKSMMLPVSMAAVGFIAGGIMLGTAGISAADVNHYDYGPMNSRGHGGVVRDAVDELLGVTRDEMIAAHEAGQTREDLILEAGYDSVDDFRDAVKTKLEEEGIDISTMSMQLKLDGEGPHGQHGGGMHRGGFNR